MVVGLSFHFWVVLRRRFHHFQRLLQLAAFVFFYVAQLFFQQSAHLMLVLPLVEIFLPSYPQRLHHLKLFYLPKFLLLESVLGFHLYIHQKFHWSYQFPLHLQKKVLGRQHDFLHLKLNFHFHRISFSNSPRYLV